MHDLKLLQDSMFHSFISIFFLYIFPIKEIDFFFGGRTFIGKNTATFSDCTLCVIKPHAIIEGNVKVAYISS